MTRCPSLTVRAGLHLCLEDSPVLYIYAGKTVIKCVSGCRDSISSVAQEMLEISEKMDNQRLLVSAPGGIQLTSADNEL